MKQSLFILSLLLVTFSGFCQTKVWTGSISNAWGEAGNWSPGGVPGAGSTVQISLVPSGNYPALSGDVEIAYLDMWTGGTGGSLYLNGHEIKTATVYVSGSSIHADGGTIRTSMIRKCDGMNFYGRLTIHTDNGIEQNNTYHGDLTVFANPHVPDGQSPASCWPCGSMMFANGEGDTFKGRVSVTNSGPGSISFVTFDSPRPTVFEKPVSISSLNSVSTSLSMNSYGGTIVFQDSAAFNLIQTGPNAAFYLRSDIDFQGAVSINQQGGLIGFASSMQSPARASSFRMRKDLTVSLSGGGRLDLGSWGSAGRNILTIDPTSALHFEGVNAGTVTFAYTVIGIPNAVITTVTHPSGSYYAGSWINFDGAEVNGDIRVKADHIAASWTKFQGKTVLHKDGAAGETFRADYGSAGGNNTFYGPTELRNTAGFDWRHGYSGPDVYKDSLNLFYDGSGEKLRWGWQSGVFKVGMADNTRIEGALGLATGPTAEGEFYLGSLGSGPVRILDQVDLTGVSSGNVTFNACRFEGPTAAGQLKLGGGSPRLSLLSSVFERLDTVEAPHIQMTNSEFMAPLRIEKVSAGDDNSVGGNTFHQSVQFKNTAASGQIRLLSGEDKLVR